MDPALIQTAEDADAAGLVELEWAHAQQDDEGRGWGVDWV